MRKLSRRNMLVHSARAVASLSVCQGCMLSRSIQEGRSRGFKIGVCDWTLGKATNPEAFVLARQIGLDGVLVDFGAPQNDRLPLTAPSLRDSLLRTAREQNVAISTLAMGTLNNHPLKSDSRAEGWLSEAITTSATMQVPVILVACFGKGDLRNDPKGVDNVVTKLKNLAPKASKNGVILALESWLSADENIDILQRVGSPAVRVYYDVGNSHKCGYNIFEEIRILGEQICEFHAKDYDDLYGKGSIDFPQVRRAMDDIGYRGWIVMEGTQMPLGIEESCRYDLAYLRSVFPPVL